MTQTQCPIPRTTPLPRWGIFTRFDPARDMLFSEQTFVGARPVYRGTIGIDATWKEGYPAPLVMDESIVKLVDRHVDRLRENLFLRQAQPIQIEHFEDRIVPVFLLERSL